MVTPTSAEKETANKKAEEAKEIDSKESNTDKTDKDKPAEKDAKKMKRKQRLTNRQQRAGKERAATVSEKLAKKKIVSIDAGRKYFSPEQLKGNHR